MDLSVIVNFYNMQREAARTLHSLSRAYQLDVEDLQYEVLAIDNGSDPPLDPDWVASFGPEFRLIRPEPAHPSPVSAINAAAGEAKGRNLAIMIDGAHVLTPGVFREAMAALREDPECIVGLRRWFVGGDQRWLSLNGYTRELEDILFENIRWPSDGYALFRVSTPLDEHGQHWFRGDFESNCLFLPAELYRRIGGFDEGFDEPGAGLANLDLYNRAMDGSQTGMVALLGEASFHQFHGGTTTNVSDTEKDRRVNVYRQKYYDLKGQPFRGPTNFRQRLRGHTNTSLAFANQRRPDFPKGIPVTAEVRPRGLEEAFERGLRHYILSTYAEATAPLATPWLDGVVNLYPADLVVLQEIAWRTRPTGVVLVNPEPGLIRFADSILQLAGVEDPLLIQVGGSEAIPPPLGLTSAFRRVRGDIAAEATLAKVGELLGARESTLVLFAAEGPRDSAPQALQSYGHFVSHRGYLVVLRSVLSQPYLGYATRRLDRAIQALTKPGTGFVVDRTWDANLLSSCPGGFILRVGDPNHQYEASLDELAAFQVENEPAG